MDQQGAAGQREELFHFLLFLTQNRELADEVTQETFKQVLAEGLSPEHIRDYGEQLRVIAKNILRNHRRRWSRQGLVFNSDMVEMAEGYFVQAGANQDDAWEARKKALLSCIGRLSETNRGLLNRRYEEGQDVKDIAGAVGMEPNTLSKRLERIRIALRDCVRILLGGKAHE